MTDEPTDAGFFDRADAVIHVANGQCQDTPVARVSASTLYAAARFNAFNVACSAQSADEMRGEAERAVAFFLKQYEAMLRENLDDYISHFGQYKGSAE